MGKLGGVGVVTAWTLPLPFALARLRGERLGGAAGVEENSDDGI